jgi:hypothetical protein
LSSPRFSIIPAGAVTDRSLEPRDLQVLCLLGRHTDKAGWCVRSQVKMAIELDCGRSSVQRSLERLCEAGWVQKKQRGTIEGVEPGQPSSSYAYRVVLDRDDFAFDAVVNDHTESHAENASDDAENPPVGTSESSKVLPADGHPGAQPYVGTGAHTYVGTKNVPLEQTPLERERDTRARDRKARFLVDFEKRWPSAASDNRQRTAYAADALTEAEEAGALAGIAPFLENQKRLHRKNVPAGWRYLEEKRWTLLEAKENGPTFAAHALDSPEARALATLFEIAGKGAFFHTVMKRESGIFYTRVVTPQLATLAQAMPKADWVALDKRQAGAWEGLLREFVTVHRPHLKEGDRAPWPWPPRKDGTLSTTGPPETLMTEQDYSDFK